MKMKDKMYSVTCDPMCGFMVQSHDEDEVTTLAMEHVSGKHPEKGISMDQIKPIVMSAS